MTIARLLPLHIHGALEAALAVVIMAAAFLLGLAPVAMIAAFALGATILAVSLATHASDGDGMPISTHLAFDLIFALVAGVAAIAFALVGDVLAASLLGAAAVSQTLLNSLTRYSPGHG